MAKTEGVNLWIEFTPFNPEYELSISKNSGIDTLGIIAGIIIFTNRWIRFGYRSIDYPTGKDEVYIGNPHPSDCSIIER